jgi:hypothetical protein
LAFSDWLKALAVPNGLRTAQTFGRGLIRRHSVDTGYLPAFLPIALTSLSGHRAVKPGTSSKEGVVVAVMDNPLT